ncbi:hypothetical protein FOXG_20330 [Fusarium oxysporum f. sp. lycopersici 4287]|uniref:Uncharacterized protein n=2 Tax=Fusarium oxysporum TaxID=5507 RepID=A0A0J9VH08_FUSO4|nr:hypothetical protein FOXG_20330 [Fusarium oxysporum f. sp. lycopersici 4287]EXK40573.1 hypothetical protein FOMG_07369 [Fusarium oxysporum f. sp. melonis 26406]KAJ9422548.1 S-adenosyl-L-methionine-dependent methyltransferase [Fusarium oxysporum]KNB10348.1 hypothetical protein FOXG_20330 [Fusarium oxysporum f. sp. lycopersici 4287]
MEMAPSDIIKRMQDAAVSYDKQELGARETLLDLNRQLLAELETPTDFIQRIWFATASLGGCLEVAANRKIFQLLQGAENGLTTQALSEKTGIAGPLLERFMRHFVAHKVVRFSKSTGWHATTLSNTLAQENYQHSISFCQRAAAKSFCHFPDHFKQANYQHPGLTDGPYQYAHNWSLPFFDWLAANPPFVNLFGSFMSVYRAGNTYWWTFYPVEERLSSGFDTNISDVFLVDVGGGRGHDLLSFSNSIKPPGRLILQDLPEVIADVTDKSVFETQKHDFFTPQPVQHARAYFLHSILHDWSVEHGVQILKNLKPALKPGYSKVLINEIVLSEENLSVPATSMDMMMLGHIGEACERTEETFRAIVADAGLEVVDVYFNAASPESVIEVMLPCSDSALEESKL